MCIRDSFLVLHALLEAVDGLAEHLAQLRQVQMCIRDRPEAAQNALPDIYAVLDGKTSDDSASVQTELLTESDGASAFTQDGAADALRSLSYGEAAAVQINGSTLLLICLLYTSRCV